MQPIVSHTFLALSLDKTWLCLSKLSLLGLQ